MLGERKMTRIRQIGFALMFLVLLPVGSVGQVDEISQATGLPIPIGAPVIYGQVSIRGIARDERRPIVFAVLYDGGVQLDRRQAYDSGYYYFLRTPQNGYVLAFEVDGMEVGRTVIIAGMSNRVRQDIFVDWQSIKGASRQITGTVSARDSYLRSADAEKALDTAMAAFREQKHNQAIPLFKAIVEKDPQDFFAWTILGAIYLAENKLPESLQALDKALQLKPDFGLALITMGKLELTQKNFDKAIGVLSRAVQVSPQSAEANHMLGEAYLQAKKGSLAVGYLNKAIELAPIEKAEIHLRLALLYNAAGLKDRAVAEYKAFLAKVKDHPDRQRIEQYIKDNSSN
jgi:tetratricopeptide (TPR) repeat protein